MVNNKLGKKHSCQSCEIKFFDLNKEIPVCPKCGQEIITKIKPRLGRPPLKKNINKVPTNNIKEEPVDKTNNEEEIEVNNEMEEIISLQDIENTEEEITETAEDINIISEENNEDNIDEITDININEEKEDN